VLSLGLVTVELKMSMALKHWLWSERSLEYAWSLPLAVGNQGKNLQSDPVMEGSKLVYAASRRDSAV